ARTMLRHILEDISPELEVMDFGEPQQALRWCAANRPDLLLLDYRMPVIGGLECARRCRKPLLHRDVPSGREPVGGGEPIRPPALARAACAVRVRPVRRRELRARCRNLLQQRQQSGAIKHRAPWHGQGLLSSMHEVEEREGETLSRLARAIE